MDEFDRLRGAAPTERAKNYLFYDYYDFLVNPELRPAGDAAGERAFLGTVTKFGNRLAGLGVLNNLNETQQDELAALVADFTGKFELYLPYKAVLERLRELPDHLGKRRMMQLEESVAIIRTMTESLPAHHPFIERNELEKVVQAADAFKAFTPFTTAESVSEFIRLTREEHPQPTDPTMPATCQLFWYLCAQVRSA